MYAYNDIRKVPLDYQGITSSAYAVQRKQKSDWKECGVVGSNYLLVPNSDVRDLAQEIATESKLEWTHTKEFFDGRRFMYFMQTDSKTENISKDDDIALGMGFWNSYDGSTSLQFRTFLVRLVCTNGMVTKDFMNLMRFKHDKNSDKDYQKEIGNAAKIVDSCGPDMKEVADRMRKMALTNIGLNDLAVIRNSYLPNIPVTLWGKISTHFLNKNASNILDGDVTMWDFYNACTDVLWHEEKPTMASFEHNQRITDNFLQVFA